jgi:hypothetical protein
MSATGFQEADLLYTFSSPTMVGHDVTQPFTEAPGADGDFLLSGNFDVGVLTVTNTSIRLDMNSSYGISFAPGDKISVSDAGDGVPDIIGFTMITNVSGLSATNIAFTADSITITMPSNLDWLPSQYLEISVTFDISLPPANTAPAFSGSAQLTVDENETSVGRIRATDGDGDALTYSVLGGADAGLFRINAQTGALSFKQAPDFEQPGSAAGTNTYKVNIGVSDGIETTSRLFSIVVLDVPGDEPPVLTSGTAGNDTFLARLENSVFDGGDGTDSVNYGGKREDFTIKLNADGSVTITDGTFTQSLLSIERVEFSDGVLLFNLDGEQAAAAYRLFGGAFDRVPDEAGLLYWVDWLAEGGTITEMARLFLASAEFAELYDQSLPDEDLVALLYQNILGRNADEAGIEFWTGYLGNGGEPGSVLQQFTQLPEYVGISAPDHENGFWVK